MQIGAEGDGRTAVAGKSGQREVAISQASPSGDQMQDGYSSFCGIGQQRLGRLRQLDHIMVK